MEKIHLNILCLLVFSSYSYNSYAVNVSPKKASYLKSYDFGELIKSYMPSKSTSVKWNYNTNDQKIIWDTGVEWDSHAKNYEKRGYVRINFDNYRLSESEFKNIDNFKSEAAWTITYSGNSNKNVDMVSLDHGETAGMTTASENEQVEPFKSLIKEGITYKPVCLYEEAAGNHSIAYELSAANKKNVYLIQSGSSGSGGLSMFYNLFYQEEAMFRYFNDYHYLEDYNNNCLVL